MLIGGLGADDLTGGAGADTFVIAEGDGGATVALADVIADFQNGSDLIGLAGGLTFADLSIDQGADTFVIAEGDGGATVELADVISDFADGSDLIGLADGLAFGDLTIDQSADVTGDAVIDTVISVTATGEFLAVLDGIGAAITIDQNDVIVV